MFTSQYSSNLYDYRGIMRSMSTEDHHQTDGPTERMNQVMEAYLRSDCDFEQNDWAEMFPMAKLAFNNSKHSSTKKMPLYANYGYEPRIHWSTDIQIHNPESEMYGHYTTRVQEILKQHLAAVWESMAKYYNKMRKCIEKFKKGELVLLNRKNIRSKGRCRKLEDKMYRPFQILSVGHNDCCCKLRLLTCWTINPTFNIRLLEQYSGKDPGERAVDIEAGCAGWEMEEIMASRPSNDNISKQVHLVKWDGHSHKENTWGAFENVKDHPK